MCDKRYLQTRFVFDSSDSLLRSLPPGSQPLPSFNYIFQTCEAISNIYLFSNVGLQFIVYVFEAQYTVYMPVERGNVLKFWCPLGKNQAVPLKRLY